MRDILQRLENLYDKMDFQYKFMRSHQEKLKSIIDDIKEGGAGVSSECDTLLSGWDSLGVERDVKSLVEGRILEIETKINEETKNIDNDLRWGTHHRQELIFALVEFKELTKKLGWDS